MRVLIFGGSGQAGRELQSILPSEIEVFAPASVECSITNGQAVERQTTEFRPDLVFNCAAYTAVDRAEDEKERAFAVNGEGAKHIAAAAQKAGAFLVHVSTDFVFDGTQSRPYRITDLPSPLGIYGASKLQGEQNVQEICGRNCAVLRTSWLYSSYGNNFVKTMLRLMGERDRLQVVSDQVGTPTWARGLAQALWQIGSQKLAGLFHWSDAGVASWYDFSVAIMEEALDLGLLAKEIAVAPISSSSYPTAARRPSYSVLDKTSTWDALGGAALHWRKALRAMLVEWKESHHG